MNQVAKDPKYVTCPAMKASEELLAKVHRVVAFDEPELLLEGWEDTSVLTTEDEQPVCYANSDIYELCRKTCPVLCRWRMREVIGHAIINTYALQRIDLS